MTELTLSDKIQAQRRIDALVVGELAEAERRELLAWLDGDVSRWRQFGLAFLEAQLWEQAVKDLGAGNQGTVTMGQEPEVTYQPPEVEGHSMVRAGNRPRLVPLLMAAASIAAFFCGVVATELWRHSEPPVQPIAGSNLPAKAPAEASAPLVATVPVQGGTLGHIAATLQIPVRPVDAAPSDASSSVPESVRRQWLRRGYELVEERRYLPAKLPDGRQVMVPVNEVKMKFVGKPVS